MRTIWQDLNMGSRCKIVSDEPETYVVAQKMKGPVQSAEECGLYAEVHGTCRHIRFTFYNLSESNAFRFTLHNDHSQVSVGQGD